MTDASALLEYLLMTDRADAVGRILRDADGDLAAPSLCDVEVAAGLRQALRLGALSGRRAFQALEDHLALPLTRYGHQALLGRILELRANFSAYDATYVALAERLGASLLTADRRLGRAARSHTDLIVLP